MACVLALAESALELVPVLLARHLLLELANLAAFLRSASPRRRESPRTRSARSAELRLRRPHVALVPRPLAHLLGGVRAALLHLLERGAGRSTSASSPPFLLQRRSEARTAAQPFASASFRSRSAIRDSLLEMFCSRSRSWRSSDRRRRRARAPCDAPPPPPSPSPPRSRTSREAAIALRPARTRPRTPRTRRRRKRAARRAARQSAVGVAGSDPSARASSSRSEPAKGVRRPPPPPPVFRPPGLRFEASLRRGGKSPGPPPPPGRSRASSAPRSARRLLRCGVAAFAFALGFLGGAAQRLISFIFSAKMASPRPRSSFASSSWRPRFATSASFAWTRSRRSRVRGGTPR